MGDYIIYMGVIDQDIKHILAHDHLMMRPVSKENIASCLQDHPLLCLCVNQDVKVIQMIRALSFVPLLVLTSQCDGKIIHDYYEAGADEVGSSSIHPSILACQIKAYIRRTRDYRLYQEYLIAGSLKISYFEQVVIKEEKRIALTYKEHQVNVIKLREN